jgi:hypothetical protein
MTTSYHTESINLLQCEDEVNNLQAVLDCEESAGVRLPTSIRQFYANTKLTKIVDRDSGDHLIAATKLELMEATKIGRLVFMVENQGVFLWAAALDASEDPPVLVREFRENKPWIACSDRFSTYVYTRVFENQFWTSQGYGINCAMETFAKVTDSDLEFLRGRFKEEPTTFGWPSIIYRFSDGWEKRVTIYNDDFGATMVVMANDSVNFRSLKTTLEDRWQFAE